MSEKTFKIVNGDMSDGYHTFDELYDNRCLLYINLCLAMPDKATWKDDFEGWFCLYLQTQYGQISYHIPEKFKYTIKSRIKNEETKWNGHKSEDVIRTLWTCAFAGEIK